MRKRNCDNLFDNILWYLIYLLPLIIGLLIYRSPEFFTYIYEDLSYGPVQFGSVMHEVLLDMGIAVDSGTVAVAFYDVLGFFGTTGNEAWLAQYFAYFVIVYCGHLMVDFILFIPRLAHKWMKDFTQGD